MKFTASVFQLMVLQSFILPAVVALVTKANASPVVKQVTLIFLSALATVIATVVANVEFNVMQLAMAFATQFILATAAFFGLNHVVYTPLSNKTADVGIGPKNSF